MNLIALITEGALSLALLVVVAAFVLGWKPRLNNRRTIGIGSLLLMVNFTSLFLAQEKGVDLYGATFWLIALPTLCLIRSSENDRDPLLWGLATLVILMLWSSQLVVRNYISASTMTVMLTLIFLRWRDLPNPESKRAGYRAWVLTFGVLCFFLSMLVWAPAFGWEKITVTRYVHENRWMLAISAALFLLVKAVPEELVFRGILQSELNKRLGFLTTLIGSAAIYGIWALNNPAPWAFPNWHAAINALALGLACGFVYHKTKSLATSSILNGAVSWLWFVMFRQGGF